MRFKPSSYCLFSFKQRDFVDLNMLNEALLSQETRETIVATCLIASTTVELTVAEFDAYRVLNHDRWLPQADLLRLCPGITLAKARQLAHAGLFICDSSDPKLSELRERHELLNSTGWDRSAAFLHFMARWRDHRLDDENYPETFEEIETSIADSKHTLETMLEVNGPLPPAFHSRLTEGKRIEFDVPSRDSALAQLLDRRKTTRTYDKRQPMTAQELSTILYYVNGCHGTFTPVPGMTLLKKSNPSPGALHAIEAYPLVINVDGIAPGLYHYVVSDHSLDLISSMRRKQAREFADMITAGQGFPSHAGAVFVLTARFERVFWKYRNMPVAYTGLMVEVGHVSQTFYLVCAELSLGAFVTQAINGCNIDEELGLDGIREGSVAIVGCGRFSSVRSSFDPEFSAYTPRLTGKAT